MSQNCDPSSRRQCPYCGKVMARSHDLSRHILIHTGEKPFVCQTPGCGKAFNQATALKIHENIHTGAKPFKCSQCPQAFGDPSSHQRHVRDQHIMKDYRYCCPVSDCRKKVQRSCQFKEHLMKKHGLNLDSDAISTFRVNMSSETETPALEEYSADDKRRKRLPSQIYPTRHSAEHSLDQVYTPSAASTAESSSYSDHRGASRNAPVNHGFSGSGSLDVYMDGNRARDKSGGLYTARSSGQPRPSTPYLTVPSTNNAPGNLPTPRPSPPPPVPTQYHSSKHSVPDPRASPPYHHGRTRTTSHYGASSPLMSPGSSTAPSLSSRIQSPYLPHYSTTASHAGAETSRTSTSYQRPASGPHSSRRPVSQQPGKTSGSTGRYLLDIKTLSPPRTKLEDLSDNRYY